MLEPKHRKSVGRTCGTVTPAGFEGIATAGTLSAPESSALYCSDASETGLLCRATVALPATASGEMMYMPGGTQAINPVGGGIGQPIKVMVDADAAGQLDRQRAALMAKGKRPYFDFNHADEEASFWPEAFFWKDSPEPGVYCRGEWTTDGKAKVEGKAWRQFSPVFHVDNKRANPARIVCRDTASPNMGGLVNNPAFHSILPLWAKAAGAASDASNQNQNTSIMTDKELAALQSRIESLEQDISALKAKDTAEAASELRAKNAELAAAKAELNAEEARKENESLRAKNEEQAKAIKARNETDAKGAVKRAMGRGAIATKDTKTQDVLVAKATDDPSFIAVIDAMQGNPTLTQRMTGPERRESAIAAGEGGGRVRLTRESLRSVLTEYGRLVRENMNTPLSAADHEQKSGYAREAAAIFAAELSNNALLVGMSVNDLIAAADYTDPNNQVGTLTGTLVLQKALELMQFEYPILNSIFTDFSDAPGVYNQTEVSRIVLTPAVQNYDPTLGTDGTPNGFTTSSPAQTVDVPITLNKYKAVPITFGITTLASTMRNLFGETADQALYALGGAMVNDLTALFTAANYNAYAQITDASCGTTSTSTAITLGSTAGVYPGQFISGTGIPAGTFIVSVPSSGNAVMSQAATATATVTATLGTGKVPTTFATYAKALQDFNFASLGEIGAAFSNNEVPRANRSVMLNATYYQRLTQDPTFNTYFAAMRNPEIISEGRLPRLNNFNPIEAPYFPSSSYRTGFAYHRAAAAIKTRLPMDLKGAVNAAPPGTVISVTEPKTGVTVALVQFLNLKQNYAQWRPEIMYGVAVGERRAGLVLTSQ